MFSRLDLPCFHRVSPRRPGRPLSMPPRRAAPLPNGHLSIGLRAPPEQVRDLRREGKPRDAPRCAARRSSREAVRVHRRGCTRERTRMGPSLFRSARRAAMAPARTSPLPPTASAGVMYGITHSATSGVASTVPGPFSTTHGVEHRRRPPGAPTRSSLTDAACRDPEQPRHLQRVRREHPGLDPLRQGVSRSAARCHSPSASITSGPRSSRAPSPRCAPVAQVVAPEPRPKHHRVGVAVSSPSQRLASARPGRLRQRGSPWSPAGAGLQARLGRGDPHQPRSHAVRPARSRAPRPRSCPRRPPTTSTRPASPLCASGRRRRRGAADSSQHFERATEVGIATPRSPAPPRPRARARGRCAAPPSAPRRSGQVRAKRRAVAQHRAAVGVDARG
jgi:hypothetical protein